MLHLFLATAAILASAQAQQTGWGSHPPAPAWAAPASWNTVAAPAPAWASPYASLPTYQHQPAVAVTLPPPVAPTTPPATVIQTRNPDGSSTHGYQTHDGQTRTESFGPDGSVRGSYSYTDPSGKPITVNYIADRHGFRATGDHIPAGTGHGQAAAPVAAVQQTPSYAAPHAYPGFPAAVPAAPRPAAHFGSQPIATYSFNSGLGATGLYAGRK